MTAMKLLAAIRTRAAQRGLTLAGLARAAKMQPGNLRRMLANTTASPRLGSVMRLLPPLHCRIGPAGARAAAELVAYLDNQRQVMNLGWEQVLGQPAKRAIKFAAVAVSDPDGLLLTDVVRIADALHVELSLVEEPAPGVADGPTVMRPRVSRRGAARPPRAAHQSPTASPPQAAPVPASRSDLSPAPSHPASSPASTKNGDNTPGLGPLRPPRLGRYRDAPPEPRAVRPPTTSWTPRVPSPGLGDPLLPRLASLSSDQWGDVYAIAWGVMTRGASLPMQFVDRLGKMTESFLARCQRPVSAGRPTIPEPPDGWYDMLDPGLLVRSWLASRQPDYRSTDTIHHYDEHGIRVDHLALDGETMVAIRLAPHGSPHSLIDLVHLPRHGKSRSLLHAAVLLEIKLGDERGIFRHVKAGPVFGEIAAHEHTYLLAAVSSLLVIVDVYPEGARIVWGGRAEKLSGVVLEPSTPHHAEEISPTVAVLERRLAEETGKRAAVEALLAAERRTLEEERCKAQAHEQAAQQGRQHLESTLRAMTDLQSHLAALVQSRLVADEQRQAAEVHMKEAVQARETLAAELAAMKSQHPAQHGADELAAEKLASIAAEQQSCRAVDEPNGILQHLATSEARVQKLGEELAAAQQELAGVRQAQVDAVGFIHELVAAKRFPEAIIESLTHLLGDDETERLLAQIAQSHAEPSDAALPLEPPADLTPAAPAPVTPVPADTVPTAPDAAAAPVPPLEGGSPGTAGPESTRGTVSSTASIPTTRNPDTPEPSCQTLPPHVPVDDHVPDETGGDGHWHPTIRRDGQPTYWRPLFPRPSQDDAPSRWNGAKKPRGPGGS